MGDRISKIELSLWNHVLLTKHINIGSHHYNLRNLSASKHTMYTCTPNTCVYSYEIHHNYYFGEYKGIQVAIPMKCIMTRIIAVTGSHDKKFNADMVRGCSHVNCLLHCPI